MYPVRATKGRIRSTDTLVAKGKKKRKPPSNKEKNKRKEKDDVEADVVTTSNDYAKADYKRPSDPKR
jgi:hypothetical protein